MPRVFSLLIISFSALLIGCASTPTSVDQSSIDSTKVIALQAKIGYPLLYVFDHTDIELGPVPSFHESIVTGASIKDAMTNSIGGDVIPLRMTVGRYNFDQVFQEHLISRFQPRYKLLPISNEKQTLEDSLQLAERAGAELLIRLNSFYGLAAYSEKEPATVGIDTMVEIFDVSSKNKIMLKQLKSDEIFYKQGSLDTLSDNNAALFKKRILQAAEAQALLLSSEFGLNKDEVAKRKEELFIEKGVNPLEITAGTVSGLSVSCTKPYLLAQDCGLLGAKQKITIDDNKFSIAGSEDGRFALLTNTITSGIGDSKGRRVAKAFNRLTEDFEHSGIAVTKLTMIKLGKLKQGYLIEFDGNGYAIMKSHSI